MGDITPSYQSDWIYSKYVTLSHPTSGYRQDLPPKKLFDTHPSKTEVIFDPLHIENWLILCVYVFIHFF
jgi:hypothetical protein